jgi:ribosomal protein S18 acetylase RimI-like enzyme
MQVRKYQAGDRDQVIDLWREVFADDPPHNEPSRMIDAKLAKDDLVFVAEEDTRIIAACMAGYDGHRGWLHAVAVNPAYQRRGIGEKLVSLAMDTLKQQGCIKVNLQVRSTNAQVVAFYKSLGFTIEDRISMGVMISV